MRLNVSLAYENRWIARCNDFTVEAEDLEDIDEKIRDTLKEKGYRGEIEIHMRFDMESIPSWMRQFHQHYFCRIVKFHLD